MAEEAASGLFSLCAFAILPSEDLTGNVLDEVSDAITQRGGKVLSPSRDGTLPLNHATHIISNTIDFPQYNDAAAMMIPVVRHKWVNASLTKGKAAQIRPFTPDPRMIFSDVVLSCADIPPTDKDAIIGATMALGGMDSENVTKLTTHICALSTDHEKCRIAIDKKLKCKIVLPHWFDDCFKLGKRIDEGPYLLPDPEILNTVAEAPIDAPSSAHLEGATSAVPDYIPTPKNSGPGGRPSLTAFEGKTIMLSADLLIRDRLKTIIEELIREGGGELTETVEECDWFVCQFRDGPQYVRASQLGKSVGNLSWLYHVITRNAWTSPLRRLLHYPVPRDGLPGFKDLRITVSNYGGEARIYLENLLTAAGATFTKTMKADNTHLVTARDNSEKCEAARDWNIHMVNHLWIEESYAKCELQSVTVPKYTHFPPRTNLGEVIGQTFLVEARIQALYFPGAPAKPTAASKRKRNTLEMADQNSASTGPAAGVVIGRQAHKEFDVMRDSEADYAEKTTEVFGVPAKRRRGPTTPAPGRHLRTGKENETPSTVSSVSRSAKDKALGRLSDMAPDIALYEKEKKRGLKDGHGLWGGKREADRIDRENLNRRSTSSPTAEQDDEQEPTGERRPAKKTKPARSDVQVRVILTGFKRWVNNKLKEDADRKKLREMGILVVQDGQALDYLIAPQLVRTVKFLRNLSKGATVLSSSWIEDCLDAREYQDPDAYVLKDRDNEKKFGLRLETSVRRAKEHRGRLLRDVPIYCTAGIKNGPESYQVIAEANGALFKVYGPRSGTTIRPTRPEEDDGAPPEPVYLLSSTTPDEKRLWPRFEEMARKGNMEPRIVASDWLLDVVMKQEVGFEERYLVANFF
ncbi:BRCT domain-containing protein [Xylariaceae sp. FL0804]|nr:BRCT domain-containing protein [Xylariaceae sp. FL0804]